LVRKLMIAATILVIAGLLVSWLFGSWMMRGHSTIVARAVPPAHDIRLTSTDGIGLAATYNPGCRANSPAVLLLHGNDSSRGVLASNASWLAAHGYATLTIDFRGHGESTITPHSFGLNEARDVRAAFDWLKLRQSNAPVAIIGISLGGAASLIGEGGPTPADALVLQAVYSDLRSAIRNRIAAQVTRLPALILEPLLSQQTRLRLGVPPERLAPIEELSRYHGHLLLIGGANDRYTPPSEVKRMLERANPPKEIWLAPNVDHAAVSAIETAAYRERLLAFFVKAIGPPACKAPRD
jgi:pimeloyl-ACP methyl ester carboxylesterase